jgi:hypothetical protein
MSMIIIFSASKFEISAGGVDRITNETFEQRQISTNFTMHKDYDSYWTVNDIALIFLPQPFELSRSIN